MAGLTLIELKEMVDEFVEMFGEEKAEQVEVRFAGQPNWPFEYSLESYFGETGNEVDLEDDEKGEVLYLVEGRQLGYLPGAVKDHLGW